MAEHHVTLRIQKDIEVGNTDLKVKVWSDDMKVGTLYISKGTIDWRPLNAKRGKKGETQLTWAEFDAAMKRANRNRRKRSK